MDGQHQWFWVSSGPFDGPLISIAPDFPAQTFSNPRVFAWAEFSVRNAFTAGGSVAQVQDINQVIDLTDGTGHGILIATDNIYVTCSESGYAAAHPIAFKLLYRLKTVSLSEYVGMVQSQQ